MNNLLESSFMGNSLFQIAAATGAILGGILVIRLIGCIAARTGRGLAVEGNPSVAGYLIRAHRNVEPVLYLVIIYVSLAGILSLPGHVEKKIYIAFVIGIMFLGIRLLSKIIRDALKAYFARREQDKSAGQIDVRIRGITTFINIILWIIGSIFIIDNIGFNISAIVTGLGIGGVALALASQSVLGDLFNYFVIFFDEPFKTGDFIVVADKMGAIEKIGVKTTRIRSLGGEEIIIANTDLMNSRIHNYGSMKKRRVVLNIGVVYRTSTRSVEAIPAEIRRIIGGIGGLEFDRAHFRGFGESALLFEAVYYILDADYNTYMDRQQEVNITILKRFRRLGIEFAYPTTTVHVER